MAQYWQTAHEKTEAQRAASGRGSSDNSHLRFDIVADMRERFEAKRKADESARGSAGPRAQAADPSLRIDIVQEMRDRVAERGG